MFSANEQRFLRREHATVKLGAMIDLRDLGCPERIYQRILEHRAKKLGTSFVRETTQIPDDLDVQIAASKLF